MKNKKYDDNNRLASQIDQDFNVSKSHNEKYRSRWALYDEYMDDMQWEAEENSVDDWMPQPQVNLVYSTVRNIHATTTGGKTAINVVAKRDNKKLNEKSENITTVMNYYWEHLDMENKKSEAEWIRILCGAVWYKTFWNPKLNNNQGDLDIQILYPGDVFLDTNINNPFKLQDSEYADIVLNMSIRRIIQEYSKENDETCRYTIKELKDKFYSEDKTHLVGDKNNNEIVNSTDEYNRNNTQLHEYWYKHMDDNGKVTLQVAWMVNRCVIKSSMDDPEIRENGFYEHGRYPLILIPYVQVPNRLYGRSEVQALVGTDRRDGLQDIVNKLLQDYMINEKLNGQGQWAIRKDALTDINQLTNEPGAVFEVPDPHGDIRKIPGQNQNDLLPVIDWAMDGIDKISGQYEILRGGNMTGVNTVGQTSLLLEQGQKPLNSKIETANWGYAELVKSWIYNLAEFGHYRSWNIKGEDVSDIFENEKAIKDEINESIADPVTYMSNVDIGAKMAFSKSALMDLGISLYQQQLLDVIGVYELLPSFPGKEDSLKRLLAAQGIQQNENGELEPIQQPQQPMQQDQQPQVDTQALEEFISILPQEIINEISQMDEQSRVQYLTDLMNSPEGQQMIEEAKRRFDVEEIEDYVATLPENVKSDLDAIPDEDEKLNLIMDMMSQTG